MSIVNSEGKVRNIFGFYERPLAVDRRHLSKWEFESQWSFESRARKLEEAMNRKLMNDHAGYYQTATRSEVILNADRSEGKIVAAITGRKTINEDD